jgi:large subunit ribosomal protein L34e
MPAGKHKSRSLRRVQKTTPGGKTKQYYVTRKPKMHKCAICGIELKGIPRLNNAKAKNAPKSAKKVERAFGGFLCANCLKNKLKAEIRQSISQ